MDIAGTTQEAIRAFKRSITAEYECKGVSEMDRILNMEVSRNLVGCLFLFQFLCVHDVLEKFEEYLPAKGTKSNDAENAMYRIWLHMSGATQLVYQLKKD